MGIQRLIPQGGGTDWSKYVPYIDKIVYPIKNSGQVDVKILEINGAGYFSSIVFRTQESGLNFLEVVVDGKSVFRTGLSITYKAITEIDPVYMSDNYPRFIGYGSATFAGPAFKELPRHETNNTLTFLIPQKIFFKKNLEIYVGDYGDTSKNHFINFVGGLKI